MGTWSQGSKQMCTCQQVCTGTAVAVSYYVQKHEQRSRRVVGRGLCRDSPPVGRFLVWWWREYLVVSQLGIFDTIYGQDGELNATTTERIGIPIALATVQNSSVLRIIKLLPNGNTYQALFDASGVASKLSGRGPYTVFVSTDGAFAHLPPDALSAMTEGEMRRLVEYHIVVGKAIDLTATAATSVAALSNDSIPITAYPADHAAQVGSGWVMQGFRAQNGIVYTISAVLLPPSRE
jgi:uncharacterized surface protein with fasciclin (FAS1) repeats